MNTEHAVLAAVIVVGLILTAIIIICFVNEFIIENSDRVRDSIHLSRETMLNQAASLRVHILDDIKSHLKASHFYEICNSINRIETILSELEARSHVNQKPLSQEQALNRIHQPSEEELLIQELMSEIHQSIHRALEQKKSLDRASLKRELIGKANERLLRVIQDAESDAKAG